jgi:hypothetical protein
MTEYDTFKRGIGITTLASERGTVDDIRESSPIAINGVALPENTVLNGGQNVDHFYPPDAAQRAADILQQQLDDAEQTVHIVKNFHDIEGQAAADDIIGEVTSVAYQQGVGVVFGGEITDQPTAEKIALGYLDVSPSVARSLGAEQDPQMEARPVTDVAGFRDIAVVGQGQPGADVDVGTNPSIEALARDALADGGDDPTDSDTMSLDDAKQTLADEYDIDVETLEERLTADDDGTGADADDDTGDDGDESPEGTVVLVEATDD